MAITTNIAPNILVPGVYQSLAAAKKVETLTNEEKRILAIGQMLGTGTATAGTPVLVTRADDATALFGRGSQLEHLVKGIFAREPLGPVWALPVEDNSASASATGTLTITGPATQSGTLTIYIARMRVEVGVTSGDTATVIATALAAAINANGDLPVTATSSAAVVTLTARHKGSVGNTIDVRANYRGLTGGEAYPAGVGISTSMPFTLSGGTSNPDLATALASLPAKAYHQWLHCYSDATSITLIENTLLNRWGSIGKPQREVSVTSFHGTVSAFITYLGSRNSQFSVIRHVFREPTYAPFAVASFGTELFNRRVIRPSKPAQNILLPDDLPAAEKDQLTWQERQSILAAGGATTKVGEFGGVYIERCRTTYKTNEAGAPDETFRDVETVHQAADILLAMDSTLRRSFPAASLVDDTTPIPSGVDDVIAPRTVKGELVALGTRLQQAFLIDDIQLYKDGLVVERDANDRNRLNIGTLIRDVKGARVFAIGHSLLY